MAVTTIARSGSDTGLLERQGATILRGDLADAAVVQRALEGVDVVVHCAAKVGDWGPVEEFRAVNVEGLRVLLVAEVPSEQVASVSFEAGGLPNPLRPLALIALADELRPEAGAVYDYEPDEEEILAELLPRNIAVQIFRALLENTASFYGAQMSAMDNATRNAGEMIRKQTLRYNRTRQAMITKELIEIISGAEAV